MFSAVAKLEEMAIRAEYLSLSLVSSAVFGLFVILHMARIRESEQRAIRNLQETETALRLTQTTRTGTGPKIFQYTVILSVVAYAVAAIVTCFPPL